MSCNWHGFGAETTGEENAGEDYDGKWSIPLLLVVLYFKYIAFCR